jgi:hypothetical protein
MSRTVAQVIAPEISAGPVGAGATAVAGVGADGPPPGMPGGGGGGGGDPGGGGGGGGGTPYVDAPPDDEFPCRVAVRRDDVLVGVVAQPDGARRRGRCAARRRGGRGGAGRHEIAGRVEPQAAHIRSCTIAERKQKTIVVASDRRRPKRHVNDADGAGSGSRGFACGRERQLCSQCIEHRNRRGSRLRMRHDVFERRGGRRRARRGWGRRRRRRNQAVNGRLRHVGREE